MVSSFPKTVNISVNTYVSTRRIDNIIGRVLSAIDLVFCTYLVLSEKLMGSH